MSFACPECGAVLHLALLSSSIATKRHEKPTSDESQIVAPESQRPVASADLRQVAHVVDSKSFTPSTRQNHEYSEDFLLFWSIYPLKKDKRKSSQAWRNALRRADATTILAAAKKYRDDPNRVDGFTKYPSTWLNATDFTDDPPLPARLAPWVQPAAPDPRESEREVERLAAEIAARRAT